MKWFSHKSLSEIDFNLLKGSKTLEQMMVNKLAIVYGPNDQHATAKELGLFECKHVYYYRKLQDRTDTVEILFSSQDDMNDVKNHLVQYKMSFS